MKKLCTLKLLPVLLGACLLMGCASTKPKKLGPDDYGFDKPGGCVVNLDEAPLSWKEHFFGVLELVAGLMSFRP